MGKIHETKLLFDNIIIMALWKQASENVKMDWKMQIAISKHDLMLLINFHDFSSILNTLSKCLLFF